MMEGLGKQKLAEHMKILQFNQKQPPRIKIKRLIN